MIETKLPRQTARSLHRGKFVYYERYKVKDIKLSLIYNFSVTDRVMDFSIKFSTFKRTVG